MVKLYLDEDCSDKKLKKVLIEFGYDVQTTAEANNIGKDDKTQLIYAVSQNRAIVTHNRKDFIRIHKKTPNHTGIIVCTQNPNNQQLAEKIDEKIRNIDQLTNLLLRVNRPQK
jgi:predicted nuclease of predicted toxin-antitoxin system